jgi:hypothetical protein
MLCHVNSVVQDNAPLKIFYSATNSVKTKRKKKHNALAHYSIANKSSGETSCDTTKRYVKRARGREEDGNIPLYHQAETVFRVAQARMYRKEESNKRK